MKRIMLLMLTASVIAVSCERSEFEPTPNESGALAINLTGQIDQVISTRVSAEGFCDGDAVGIYVVNNVDGTSGTLSSKGNQVDNLKYTFNEADLKWASESPAYYKDASTLVDIYGYYPYVKNISDVNAYEFTIKSNQRSRATDKALGGYEASDFLFGCTTSVTPTKDAVGVVFKHKMASLIVELVKGDGWDGTEEWESASKDVLVENTVLASKINLGTGEVTKSSTGTPESIIPMATDGNSWRAIVVPQEITANETLLTITIDGIARTYSKDVTYTYYSGKMNTLVLSVSKPAAGSGIELTLVSESIKAWEDDGKSHNGEAMQYVVIDSPEGESLAESITKAGYDLTKIKNIKITGHVTAEDFYMMRDQMPMLEAVNMQEVTVKEEEIPSNAFYQKRSLKFFMFPKGITKIGNQAFSETSLSGTPVFPDGLEEIGPNVFYQTNISGSLVFPTSLKVIGNLAFGYTAISGQLYFPDGLETIGAGAFSTTEISGKLILPESLLSLGDQSFCSCFYLTGDLEIPKNIKTIPSTCFMSCWGLDGILTLPEGLTDIEYGAFWDCHFSGPLMIPSTVSTIGQYAFEGCQLSFIEFPERMSSIGVSAFSGNQLSGTIKIPEGIEVVPQAAFYNNNKIEKLIIPSSLNRICSHAFDGNVGLTSIICEAEEPPILELGAFDNVPKDNFTVEVPERAVRQYQLAPGWNEFNRIEAHRDFSISRRLFRTLNASSERVFTLRAEAGASWSVESKPEWITVEPSCGNGKTDITVTVSELPVGQGKRTGEIVYCLDGKNYRSTTYVEQYDYSYGDGDVIVNQTHSTGNGIPIVFMGDCFDGKDISEGAYLSMANEAIVHFFDIEPYKTYRDYFDVYTIFGLSQDSGVGNTSLVKEACFGSQYTLEGGLTPDLEKCKEYAKEAVGDNLAHTLVVLLLNTSDYGGITFMCEDGFAVAVCPNSQDDYPYDFRGLVQHEAGGHGFGKLADEYIYHVAFIQSCVCPCCGHTESFNYGKSFGWYDNLSLNGDMKTVPWSHMIFDPDYSDVVDVFEGGYFHSRGVFRSEENSCMNNNIPYFSSISRESIVRRIMEYAGEPFSYESFKAKDIKTGAPSLAPATKSWPYTTSFPKHTQYAPVIISNDNFNKR
ncbi:MAG: leucine-rich repeat protein [Segatella copri]